MTISKTNSKKILAVSTIIATALICFYVFQIVKLTEAGYIKGEKEAAIKELRKENAELKIAISKDRNLSNFEEKVLTEGFQKVSKVNYIVIPEISLASK